MAELNSFIKIDRLQPKTAKYLSKLSLGSEVPANCSVALLHITSVPDAEKALDILLTSANVTPNVCVFDGRGGWLGIHAVLADELHIAIEQVMNELNLSFSTTKQAKPPSHQLISKITKEHADIIGKRCKGHKITAGDSLMIVDVIPAVHTLVAVNEAEKNADIEVVDYKITGSSGRLYLSGCDTNVRCALGIVVGLFAPSSS